MFVVACLGNPGRKYAKNRHNIGFLLGEHIAGLYGITMNGSSFKSISGKGRIRDREALIVMPQTFMNDSGGPVRRAMEFYKVPPADLVVIHDEIELPFGRFKEKFGGGHKGHNGIRSIMQEIGTPDFHRIRFGVGRPEIEEMSVADHVLSDFSGEEMSRILELAPAVVDMLVMLMSAG